jgi:two-component system, chemotaxis family, CheB/CheR fusion protein
MPESVSSAASPSGSSAPSDNPLLARRDDQTPEFPVVGIGASAGGLEAFEQFFTGLPADTGMAFVLVQHLSPPHRSILPEIIQRFTAMPVTQVTDGIRVQPNCVYIIPPGADLALSAGHLALLKQKPAHGFRLPIDFFFRSLAEDQHEAAIGIVLSGTGSDGSLGLKSLKAEGGLTIAQAPDTAAYEDMPRNAIATQDVDFVLPPGKMGEVIQKVLRHEIQVGDKESETDAAIPSGGMQKLFFLLHARTGHDFSLYKPTTLRRRIERRMKINLIKTLEEYVTYLGDHPQEIEALFREMLINVTNFFRDPDAYQALIDKAIRPILPGKAATHAPLRVWVAGCSTGEEAYSLAIAIQEQIDALHIDCQMQIYATDIDGEAVAAARTGHYSQSIIENVSEERLQRFFHPEEQGYRIKKNVRDRVVFATQNLISDPPFSKIDLLCCRNVLIYLEPELQNQLFPLFHHALAPEGVLFLGNSESLGSSGHLFTTLDRKHKLFRRKEVVTPPRVRTRINVTPREVISRVAFGQMMDPNPTGRLRDWTEKALLEFHSPACVIVDEKHNLLFVHGHTGKFLEPAPGEMHTNLLRMAREGLKTDLATAIHAAVTAHETVRRAGIQVKTNGDYQSITLTVRPIEDPPELQGFVMVVFEEEPHSPLHLSNPPTDGAPRTRRIGELQKQLKEKDEFLRAVVDELETTNQDLKSTNEELQSTNEEMQSANEELETSKEELQSTNEELTTINAELQKKNEELAGVNNDMFNLLASTEIGTLFLDLDLRLRRFTPAVNRLYNFLLADIGRPVDHFVSRLNYDHLVADAQQVLATLIPVAIEVQAKDGAWYLVSIKPYRTLENVIDGVVITFVDISVQKQGDALRRLGTILRDANDAVTVQDFSGQILAWNTGAAEMYGWGEDEAMRMNALELVPEGRRPKEKTVLERLSRGEKIRSFETQRVTRDGLILDVWVTLTSLVNDAGQPVAVSTTERDVTARNRATRQLLYANRAFKALNLWYREIMTHSDPLSQAAEACRILVEEAGYTLAWAGRVEKNKTQSITPLFWAGLKPGEADPLKPISSLVKLARGSISKALHSRRPLAVRQPPEAALQQPDGSFLVLPFLFEQDPFGVLVVYASDPEAFADQEIEALGSFSEKLALALAPVWNQPEQPES